MLEAKLGQFWPQIVIFTFKETAKRLLGNFAGNGFVPGLTLGEIEVFAMPRPYESRRTGIAKDRERHP